MTCIQSCNRYGLGEIQGNTLGSAALLLEQLLQLAICQLVGPLAFARMTGLRTITHNDCTTLIDKFLTAHRPPLH